MMLAGALAVLAAGAACTRGGGARGGSLATSEESKRANDALWALAPKGWTSGVVVAPHGVALLDRAVARLYSLVAKLDSLAYVARTIERELQWKPGDTLGDHGLTSEKGAALFFHEDQLVVILPVNDRGRFVAKVGGQRQGEFDQLGPLRCKPVGAVYACASDEALLAQLGGGALGARHSAVEARGELELVARSFFGEVALSMQLGEGAAAWQGLWRDPMPAVLPYLGAPQRSHVASGHSGFLVFDVRPLFAEVPKLPVLASGLTTLDLLTSIAGPMQLAARPGGWRVELELPLRDAAAFTQLVQRCDQLPLLGKYGAPSGDGCRLTFSDLTVPLSFELWVDGKTLRLGERKPPPSAPVASTPLRQLLATEAWSAQLWGRGVSFDLVPTVRPADPEGARISKALQGEMLRMLALVGELGLGVRRGVDEARAPLFLFSGGVRTLFANPDDVIAKVLALTDEDVLSGAASARAKEIAAAAPSSPFAQDLAVGNLGVFLPVGVLSAIAVPSFLDYSKKAKKSESELQLGKLGRNARLYFAEHGAFPSVTSPLTPKTSCCVQNFESKRKCAPDAKQWESGAWKELAFYVEEPHYFQYNFIGGATSFVATAVGDLDCDGITVTWVLRGEVRDGEVVTELIAPPAHAD